MVHQRTTWRHIDEYEIIIHDISIPSVDKVGLPMRNQAVRTLLVMTSLVIALLIATPSSVQLV